MGPSVDIDGRCRIVPRSAHDDEEGQGREADQGGHEEHVEHGHVARLAQHLAPEQAPAALGRVHGAVALGHEGPARSRREVQGDRVALGQVAGELDLVELGSPAQEGAQEGDAHAASDVAEEVHEPGGLVGLLLGEVRVGHHVDGDEEGAQAHALDDAGGGSVPVADGEVPLAHPEQAQAGHDQAVGHEAAGVDAAHEEAHDGHADQDDEAPRRHDQPAGGRVEPEHRLEKHWDQEGAAVEDEAQREQHEVGAGEGAVLEQAQVDHRMVVVQLPEHHGDQSHHGDDGEGHDEGAGEPVVALALVQHDLEGRQADDHQGEADEVDLLAVLQAQPLEVRRIHEDGAGEHHGQDAHRDVDEEDPVPAVVVREPAAQHRPDDRGEDHADAVHRHGLPVLLRREALHQDALGGGLEPAAAQALEDAEEDQPAQGGRGGAQEAAGGEDEDAGEVEALAAHEAAEPPAHGQHHRVGHEVRGEHPGALVDGGREAARDVGQGHVRHGGVEHLHESGEHHHHGDDVGADPLPCVDHAVSPISAYGWSR